MNRCFSDIGQQSVVRTVIPENMKADEVNPRIHFDFGLEAFSRSTSVLLS